MDPQGTIHRHLMSRYAGIQLARCMFPVGVLRIASDFVIERDDRLFESWFWSSLLGYFTHPVLPARLQFRTRVGAVALMSYATEASALDKRPAQEQWVRVTFEDGYDGVYLDPLCKFVCFVRLVHDTNHARRLDFPRCTFLLETLQNAGWWDVDLVEFCYVLPQTLLASGDECWRNIVGDSHDLPQVMWNGFTIDVSTSAIGVDFQAVSEHEDV